MISQYTSIHQINGIMWPIFTAILALSTTQSTLANRVSDKIYTPLQSNHYCGRRLNETHQMGCSSDLGGNQGIVWFVESDIDLKHILETGPTPPYVAIVNVQQFTRKNLIQFKERKDRVAGVIYIDLHQSDAKFFPSGPYSPEDSCPNRYSGLYVNNSEYGDCSQNKWLEESPVTGLLHEDIPFPIFLINEQKSIEELQNCFTSNNLAKGTNREQDSYPLCGVQLDSFMLASTNSETCLNSHSLVDELLQTSGRRCYSVDNQSIFAFFKPTQGHLKPSPRASEIAPEMVDPQSVVLLTARLSSVSMFSDISPGADSTLSSLIVMLAVAEALGKARNTTLVSSSKRNIAFALLDSEPFDYTGSVRMVYNMQNSSFPNKYYRIHTADDNNQTNLTDGMKNMNLTALDYVIDLDQLAGYPEAKTVFLHTDPENKDTNKVTRLVKILESVASSEHLDFKRSDTMLPLPPSPVHEFVKKSRLLPAADQRLLGSVLSNYDKKYTNLYFNSIFDDYRNIRQIGRTEDVVDHLTMVSNFIAKSVFELTFDHKATTEVVVNKTLVHDLLKCYLIDADCDLFTTAWQAGQRLPKGPIQTYKDPTKRSDDMNGAITANILAYFIGDKMPEHNMTKCYEENEKSFIYNYNYINGKDKPVKDYSSGLCLRSQVLKVSSFSPAYNITEDGILINSSYPAWTISLNSIRNPVRLYLKPGPIGQWAIFLLGITVTVMSFIAVVQVNKYLEDLESPTLDTASA